MTGRDTGLMASLGAFAGPRMGLVMGALAVGVVLIVIGLFVWAAG
ncbi:MAG: hypothetical protein ACRD0F_07200 [Acidimicrobiales bacterium]